MTTIYAIKATVILLSILPSVDSFLTPETRCSDFCRDGLMVASPVGFKTSFTSCGHACRSKQCEIGCNSTMFSGKQCILTEVVDDCDEFCQLGRDFHIDMRIQDVTFHKFKLPKPKVSVARSLTGSAAHLNLIITDLQSIFNLNLLLRTIDDMHEEQRFILENMNLVVQWRALDDAVELKEMDLPAHDGALYFWDTLGTIERFAMSWNDGQQEYRSLDDQILISDEFQFSRKHEVRYMVTLCNRIIAVSWPTTMLNNSECNPTELSGFMLTNWTYYYQSRSNSNSTCRLSTILLDDKQEIELPVTIDATASAGVFNSLSKTDQFSSYRLKWKLTNSTQPAFHSKNLSVPAFSYNSQIAFTNGSFVFLIRNSLDYAAEPEVIFRLGSMEYSTIIGLTCSRSDYFAATNTHIFKISKDSDHTSAQLLKVNKPELILDIVVDFVNNRLYYSTENLILGYDLDTDSKFVLKTFEDIPQSSAKLAIDGVNGYLYYTYCLSSPNCSTMQIIKLSLVLPEATFLQSTVIKPPETSVWYPHPVESIDVDYQTFRVVFPFNGTIHGISLLNYSDVAPIGEQRLRGGTGRSYDKVKDLNAGSSRFFWLSECFHSANSSCISSENEVEHLNGTKMQIDQYVFDHQTHGEITDLTVSYEIASDSFGSPTGVEFLSDDEAVTVHFQPPALLPIQNTQEFRKIEYKIKLFSGNVILGTGVLLGTTPGQQSTTFPLTSHPEALSASVECCWMNACSPPVVKNGLVGYQKVAGMQNATIYSVTSDIIRAYDLRGNILKQVKCEFIIYPFSVIAVVPAEHPTNSNLILMRNSQGDINAFNSKKLDSDWCPTPSWHERKLFMSTNCQSIQGNRTISWEPVGEMLYWICNNNIYRATYKSGRSVQFLNYAPMARFLALLPKEGMLVYTNDYEANLLYLNGHHFKKLIYCQLNVTVKCSQIVGLAYCEQLRQIILLTRREASIQVIRFTAQGALLDSNDVPLTKFPILRQLYCIGDPARLYLGTSNGRFGVTDLSLADINYFPDLIDQFLIYDSARVSIEYAEKVLLKYRAPAIGPNSIHVEETDSSLIGSWEGGETGLEQDPRFQVFYNLSLSSPAFLEANISQVLNNSYFEISNDYPFADMTFRVTPFNLWLYGDSQETIYTTRSTHPDAPTNVKLYSSFVRSNATDGNLRVQLTLEWGQSAWNGVPSTYYVSCFKISGNGSLPLNSRFPPATATLYKLAEYFPPEEAEFQSMVNCSILAMNSVGKGIAATAMVDLADNHPPDRFLAFRPSEKPASSIYDVICAYSGRTLKSYDLPYQSPRFTALAGNWLYGISTKFYYKSAPQKQILWGLRLGDIMASSTNKVTTEIIMEEIFSDILPADKHVPPRVLAMTSDWIGQRLVIAAVEGTGNHSQIYYISLLERALVPVYLLKYQRVVDMHYDPHQSQLFYIAIKGGKTNLWVQQWKPPLQMHRPQNPEKVFCHNDFSLDELNLVSMSAIYPVVSDNLDMDLRLATSDLLISVTRMANNSYSFLCSIIKIETISSSKIVAIATTEQHQLVTMSNGTYLIVHNLSGSVEEKRNPTSNYTAIVPYGEQLHVFPEKRCIIPVVSPPQPTVIDMCKQSVTVKLYTSETELLANCPGISLPDYTFNVYAKRVDERCSQHCEYFMENCCTVTTTTSQIATINGLHPGSQYKISVKWCNIYMENPEFLAISDYLYKTPPIVNPLRNFKLTALTPDRIRICWDPSSHGECHLQFKLCHNTSKTSLNCPTVTREKCETMTDLTADTVYQFKVYSKCIESCDEDYVSGPPLYNRTLADPGCLSLMNLTSNFAQFAWFPQHTFKPETMKILEFQMRKDNLVLYSVNPRDFVEKKILNNCSNLCFACNQSGAHYYYEIYVHDLKPLTMYIPVFDVIYGESQQYTFKPHDFPVETKGSVPSVPLNVSVEISLVANSDRKGGKIRWEPPEEDGGSRIKAYLILFSGNDGESWMQSFQPDRPDSFQQALPYNVSLSGTYSVSIAAKNAFGTGPYSNAYSIKYEEKSNISTIVGAISAPLVVLLLIVFCYVIKGTLFSTSSHTRYSLLQREIPRSSIVLGEILSNEGLFSKVYQGTMIDDGSPVAIKIFGILGQTEGHFMHEVRILEYLKAHPQENIIRFLGKSSSEDSRLAGELPWLIFELMDHGNLHEFVKKLRPQSNDHATINLAQLQAFMIGAAKALEFLEAKNIVHRDIAARNCLLCSDGNALKLKLSDFGLTRRVLTLENDSSYYRMGANAYLPHRWMSPETFPPGRFTSKSDMWAFGVLAWETFSLGEKPYSELENEEVQPYILGGGRLPKPGSHYICPEEVYAIMLSCFAANPDDRPTPSQVIDRFWGLDLSAEHPLNIPDNLTGFRRDSANSATGGESFKVTSSNDNSQDMARAIAVTRSSGRFFNRNTTENETVLRRVRPPKSPFRSLRANTRKLSPKPPPSRGELDARIQEIALRNSSSYKDDSSRSSCSTKTNELPLLDLLRPSTSQPGSGSDMTVYANKGFQPDDLSSTNYAQANLYDEIRDYVNAMPPTPSDACTSAHDDSVYMQTIESLSGNASDTKNAGDSVNVGASDSPPIPGHSYEQIPTLPVTHDGDTEPHSAIQSASGLNSSSLASSSPSSHGPAPRGVWNPSYETVV